MKIMWRKMVGILLASSMLAGCNPAFTLNGLVKPPKLDINQQEVKQAAEQFLPSGATLTIPRQPAKASAFKTIDLDGDGVEEVVTFYKKGQTEFELGLLILKKNETEWKLRDNITGLGQEFDFVDFQDITGDKVPELLVAWSGGQWYNKELGVYTLEKNKYEQLSKTSYHDLSVGDLDGDEKADIAIMIRNVEKEIPITEVQLYQYVDGELKQTNKMEYEAVYPDRVIIGKATKDTTGVFVDVVVGAHSAYTQLLALENGQWQNALKQEDGDFPMTFKAYPLPSKDIDDDGIVEIGLQIEPPGSEGLAMVQIPWVQAWHKWDGKDGLTWVRENYADYGEKYEFNIPQNWRHKYTIKRTEDENYQVQSVDFYYIGEEQKELTPLFSIHYVNKNIWSEKEKTLKEGNISYAILGENNEKVFVGVLPTDTLGLSGKALKEYNKMLLDQDELKQAFKMLER